MWLWRAFKNSIAGKIAAAVLITTILVTAAGSTASFLAFRQAALRASLNVTQAYLEERQKGEERIFEDVHDVHVSAARIFEQRLRDLNRADAVRAFDRLFPLQSDGTRRSTDMLFDGGRDRDGVNVNGIGAFIADGADMSADEKLELYAAFLVLRDLGPVVSPRLDNLYYFTSRNRVIMFAPGREDRLEYYRRNAPANFAFQHEEFAVLATPAANPMALTRCTGLRRLLSDPTGDRLGSGCVTPFDHEGRRLGSWGTSVTLANGLRQAVQQTMLGASNAVLDRHGNLIAYGHSVHTNAGANMQATADELGIRRVMAFVRETDADTGIMPGSIDGNHFVFARINGPDWIFLSIVPETVIGRRAGESARVFLLIGVVAILIQVLLLASLMYKWVVRPTLRLAEAASTNGRFAIDELTHRQDEIGELARALAERDRRDAERIAQLAIASAEAEAANLAKSQFLAAMSHELRTPLNAVIGYTEIMREDALDARRNADVADHDRVLTAARRLLRLINEVLDLSKVEAGRMQLEVEQADVVALARDAIDAVRLQAEANGNTITLDAAANLPPGQTDNFRLSQCLLNLLSNASKFTKNGEIRVRVTYEAGKFIFQVRDTGIGIAADALPRLFEPFTQADSCTVRTFGGTGLGLAISRRMARMMGGDVVAASTPGAGSVFTLSVAAVLGDAGKVVVDDAA